jgi:hypothetical protein
MRKFIMLLPALALTAGAAWAGNCPNEMKEDTDKVKKLRADGEKAHKDGKHADSMKALGEAKKILGI